MLKRIDGITSPRKVDNPVPVRFTAQEKAALGVAAKRESERRQELVSKSSIIREALSNHQPYVDALRAVREEYGTSQDNNTKTQGR